MVRIEYLMRQLMNHLAVLFSFWKKEGRTGKTILDLSKTSGLLFFATTLPPFMSLILPLHPPSNGILVTIVWFRFGGQKAVKLKPHWTATIAFLRVQPRKLSMDRSNSFANIWESQPPQMHEYIWSPLLLPCQIQSTPLFRLNEKKRGGMCTLR